MRGWGAIWLLAMSGLTLPLPGCGDGPLSRPYNPRPGYESSHDMRPVKVDLYRYTNKGRAAPDFSDEYEIVDEPPLSFRFPDAYYYDHPNHTGGAQTQVGIHFDLDTMKPAPLSTIVFGGAVLVDSTTTPIKYRDTTPEEDSEFNRRSVTVTIDSNGHNGPGGSKFPLAENLSKSVKNDLARGVYGAQDLGVINGLSIVNYTTFYRNWTNVKHYPPLLIDGFDINNNKFSAFPVDPSTKIVQNVDCDFTVKTCTGKFIYRGRELRFVVGHRNFSQIESVGQKIVQLLDKYRLAPARKGEY